MTSNLFSDPSIVWIHFVTVLWFDTTFWSLVLLFLRFLDDSSQMVPHWEIPHFLKHSKLFEHFPEKIRRKVQTCGTIFHLILVSLHCFSRRRDVSTFLQPVPRLASDLSKSESQVSFRDGGGRRGDPLDFGVLDVQKTSRCNTKWHLLFFRQPS